MSSTTLTTAGRGLIAAAIAGGNRLNITGMAFILRANLESVDESFVPTSGEIKYMASGIAAGLADTDTVIYSAILDTKVGDFAFNAVALYAGSSIVAAVVQPVQHKIATAGFAQGNTIIKNFALQFANAGDIAGIDVAAESWQLDFFGVFALKDHNHDNRYSQLDHAHDERYSQLGHAHNYEPLGGISAHNLDPAAHPALVALLTPVLSRFVAPVYNTTGRDENEVSSGVITFPGGIKLMWGSGEYRPNISYAFPEPFAEHCFGMFFGGTASYDRAGRVFAVNKSHFRVACSSNTNRIQWFALGI